MNILFVYERKIIPTFGGVERVTYLLSKEFEKRGHNVSYLSVGPLEWNMGNEEYGFSQHYIPFSDPDFKENLEKFLKEKKIDRVIFQGGYKDVVDTLPLWPSDIKKVLVLHFQPYAMYGFERRAMRQTPGKGLNAKEKGLRYLGMIFPAVLRKLRARKTVARFLKITNGVDKFVMLSHRYIPRIERLTPGIDATKLTAINNPNTFSISSESIQYEKEKVVLMVARLDNMQKNVTGFIDVWKKFNKIHPDWRAFVVGDGPHREYIENYAQKKRIKNLSFEGNRSDIEEYYKRAAILCMTSSYEGWPMVLAEGMSLGCVPVVYNTFGAAGELIESGKNGYLVEPYNVDGMTEALCKLADDETRRKKMTENGKKKIREFDVVNIATRWEELLEIQ